MARTPTLTKLCFWTTAVLTLAGVILGSLSMLLSFDAELGYFSDGVLPVLFWVLYPVIVAATVVITLMIPKNTLATTLRTPPRAPFALAMGTGLAAFAVLGLILCLPTATSKLLLAPILTAIPASLYFFLTVNKDGTYPDWLSLLGFLPILWAVASIAETYTNLYTAMNSPVKITLQMGFIGVMLILVAELRFRLDKAAPRLALALWSVGSFLCFSGSLPIILATCVGTLTNTTHVLYAAVLLLGGAYGIYLLWHFTRTPIPAPDPDGSAEVCAEPVPPSVDPD